MTTSKSNAIVYCEGAFNTPNGKTAHGLVRFTERYRVMTVVDSRQSGKDAGTVLDQKACGIPISASVDDAVVWCRQQNAPATHLVMGLAPDGGRLSPTARRDVEGAIASGLHIVSGLHDFLSEDPTMSALARSNRVVLTDVRKPPPRSELHFFTGDIEKVRCVKIAVLGTDSAVGKRTTAWKLVAGFRETGCRCELIGTGQTAWMQGARYGIVMDSLVNDFVSGEIEHALCSAWREQNPDVLIVEGQGSLLNPAYPGGFEILAAARPDVIVLQHAPARRDYDGFPGYRIHPLPLQIQALELLSEKPVVAITINHERIPRQELSSVCNTIERIVGLPTVDVLAEGPKRLIGELAPLIEQRRRERVGAKRES